MAFEPQNDLERSLVKAAVNPAHRSQFIRDFAQSDVFIIQHGKHSDEQRGRITVAEGATIQVRTIEFEGRSCVPIFSSLRRLQATLMPDANYLAINGLEFMKIAHGARLILNPGADYGKELSPEEVASIVDGSIWHPKERISLQKETEVMLGAPAIFPTDLVEVLTGLFKKHRAIKRAWLVHYFNPADSLPAHTLIAVDIPGDFERISAEAGITIGNTRIPNPPVDFIRLTGNDGVQDYCKRAKPFYERRLIGLF